HTAVNARTVKIAARANAHDRPRGLRGCALADSFSRRIFVSRASFAPAAIVVLTALEPIAPAQNPILRHVVSNRAQTAQHLPRSVNIIHAPAPVPGAVGFLS